MFAEPKQNENDERDDEMEVEMEIQEVGRASSLA